MGDESKTRVIGLEDEQAFEAALTSGEDVVVPPDTQASAEEDQIEPSGPDDAVMPWQGKQLGHFKLLRLIGEGSMGRVVQALDVNLQRIVALKVLRKRVSGMKQVEAVHQFLREARAAANLEHPNVAHIYEINQHEGWWFIAQEMIEGGNLREVVRAAGPLPPGRACPVIADAAAALAAAHAAGIVHRDVKPTNLLLTRTGRCKLVDFGLVRIGDPNDPFDFTHKAVGTPQYMAPETTLGKPQSRAVDIYGLGATLYYALTGRPPYVGRKVSEILDQHRNAPPPDIRQRQPDHTPSLAKLVQHAMAKDPADRPTAAEFAAALSAEMIDLRYEESGMFAPGGSTIFQTMPQVYGSSIMAQSRRRDRNHRRSGAFWLSVFGGIALGIGLILTGLVIDRRGGGPNGGVSFAQVFTTTPANYGMRPPQSLPEPVDPRRDPPPFSWIGEIDAADFRFVASRSGRYYWPIDHPDAVLIRADQFVGYRTAAEAQRDNKVPAAAR